MASPNITTPQTSANGGSRESSEFEFVGGGQHPRPLHPPPQQPAQPAQPAAAVNPLLLRSNVPAPSPVSVQATGPSRPPIVPSPPSITPASAPQPSAVMTQMTHSMSAPDNMDQTTVTRVTAESPAAPGMFGWVKGSGFLSKVVERTKTVTENVITTLDPQMKEFIHSGGDIEVIVSSDKEDKVVPIREAFQAVFGKATVTGRAGRALSIAEQPVGFASGRQAALERISSVRKSGSAEAVVVSVENFLYEVNEDIWIDMSCLVLSDPLRNITLQSFSQPTNIPAPVVEKLKAGTPDNYPKQWSGFAVTIGQVMGEELSVPPSAWQEAVTGLHRRRLLAQAGEALAGMYRRAIQAKVEDV